MTANLREKTIQLRLELSEGKKKVFDILKTKGVDPAIHLIAVQELPGRLFDVTFVSVEVKRRFWPAIAVGNGYTATSYTSSATLVTVLHIPHELDDNVVRYILGRYGKVINGRYLTHTEYPQVYNGIRQYLVEINRDIPSSLRIWNRNCWVRYYGQQRKCWNCHDIGHEARDCRQIKCYKCQEMGHTAKNCNAEVKCNICSKGGHIDRKCPLSFANKINPTPSVWVSGAAVVTSEAVQEAPPGSVTRTTIPEAGIDPNMGKPMDTDPPPPVSETQPDPVVIPETQHMDGSESDNDSQCNLFDKDEVITSMTLAGGSWAEPTPQPQEVIENQTEESTSAVPIVLSEPHPRDVTKSSVKVSSPENTHELASDRIELSQGPVPSAQVEVSPPPVRHQDGVSDAPVPDKEQLPLSTSSQDTEGVHRALTRQKRKSASQPDPAKRQERSRSSIRFPTEDPRDSIKMTQIFIEDEPWHSCYAKGCHETFSQFKALTNHVKKSHPKRTNTPKYICPLKICKSVSHNPREWIQHIASKHPDFIQKHDIEFFDKYFLRDTR